jgi:FixJ family two-component response regulator
MKKTLSEAAFQKALASLTMGERSVEVTRSVLVNGEPQADVARKFGISKSAVCKQVARVQEALAEAGLPRGFQKVTVILTDHQAFMARKWSQDAERKIAAKK